MLSKTRKNKSGLWKNNKPGFHQKTVMLKRCGSKCFLGPHKSFPICKKNTCTISYNGVRAAYSRARQYKHRRISKTAKKMLIKMKSQSL